MTIPRSSLRVKNKTTTFAADDKRRSSIRKNVSIEDRSRERDDVGKYAAKKSYLRPSRHRHQRTKHEESKMASHCVRRITCGDQRRETVSLIVPWVDSRSRQLIVATRRKLSGRPRFLGHEIRAGARKGKKIKGGRYDTTLDIR